MYRLTVTGDEFSGGAKGAWNWEVLDIGKGFARVEINW